MNITWISTPLLLYILSLNCGSVKSDGQLSVKFISYSNSRGKGANGHCCDGRSIFCTSKCDHKFLICIDTFHGDDDFNHCAIGKETSDKISNQNVINFGSSIANLPNPLIMSFTTWQVPGVKVKVKVTDKDTVGSDDFVDDLRKQVAVSPGLTASQGQLVRVRISHRTTLILELKAHCENNWYGGDCQRYCVPTDNDRGHYVCDRNTGFKICRPGWTGHSCTENIDDCNGSPCQNGGQCVDGVNRFTCQCAPGFTGGRCEHEIDECILNECSNGKCVDLVAGFRCICDIGFTGTLCQSEIDHCTGFPCENNGTCVSHLTGYRCVCSANYTGDLCEDEIDLCHNFTCAEGESCLWTKDGFICLPFSPNSNVTTEMTPVNTTNSDDTDDATQNCTVNNPCLNNSTCVDTNDFNTTKCICQRGWTGERCEALTGCSLESCFNNGTCIGQNEFSYYCDCPHPYTGRQCDSLLSICDMANPCQHNSTCWALLGHQEYICICPPQRFGNFCELSIPDALEEACAEVSCHNNGTCVATIDSKPLRNDADTLYTSQIQQKYTESKDDSTTAMNYVDDSLSVETYNKSEQTMNHTNQYHTQPQPQPTVLAPTVTPDKLPKFVYREPLEDIVVDVSCACSERFTGKYCEAEIEHETITDVTDEGRRYDHDDEFVEKEKDFKEYPSALLFKQKLNDKHIEQIEDTVKELVSNHLNRSLADIDVKYEVITCLSSKKEKVNAFLFDVFVKDSVVSWETIDKAFHQISEEDVNRKLPVPLFEEETCTPLDGTVDYQKIGQKSWLVRHWYIIAICCLILVAAVFGVGYFIVRHRHHRKRAVISDYPILGERENSVESLQHQPSQDMTGNGDYFFENRVYEYEEIGS